MALLRLQKVLSGAGVASRRRGEALILAGRVSINGKVIRELGVKADPDYDQIMVDGRSIPRPSPKVYYLLYKPRGIITSLRDPEGRPTIKDLIPNIKVRVYPVGRLDYDAEGLMLLTNDGELALKLTHPRYGVSRSYLVKVRGLVTMEEMGRLERGVMLVDGMSPPMEVKLVKRLKLNSWLRVTLREGRNRVIKRTFKAINRPVLRLKRIRFASLTLEGLEPGDCRPLSPEEVKNLRR
jgi:23S rRNA pseudouridine2605 synthase